MKIPPIEFVSGKTDETLGVKMDFQSTDVDFYMWRLYDLNQKSPKPIQTGKLKRPPKGGVATAELKPVKKNTEYVLQYYAVHIVNVDS